MGEQILPLDPSQRSTDTLEFQTALRAKIVGQEEGVQALVDLYQVFCAGLNSPGRPVGNLLFLGPTGSGKTRIVEAAAEILFGDPRLLITFPVPVPANFSDTEVKTLLAAQGYTRIHEQRGATLQVIQCMVEWGRARVAAGDASGAVDRLDQAAGMLERIGAGAAWFDYVDRHRPTR